MTTTCIQCGLAQRSLPNISGHPSHIPGLQAVPSRLYPGQKAGPLLFFFQQKVTETRIGHSAPGYSAPALHFSEEHHLF